MCDNFLQFIFSPVFSLALNKRNIKKRNKKKKNKILKQSRDREKKRKKERKKYFYLLNKRSFKVDLNKS